MKYIKGKAKEPSKEIVSVKIKYSRIMEQIHELEIKQEDLEKELIDLIKEFESLNDDFELCLYGYLNNQEIIRCWSCQYGNDNSCYPRK